MLYLLLFLLITFPLAGESSGETGKSIELDVPWYGQEEAWGDAFLGDSRKLTIHTHGCALTATAMVFSYYGANTNPEELNKRLLKAGAFEKGWDDDSGAYLGRVRMIWDKAAGAFDEVKAFKRYDFADVAADVKIIRSYLDRKIPVIAEVVRPGGIPHFVVISGYRGEDFFIQDPVEPDFQYLSDGYNVKDKYGSGAARNIYGIRVFLPENPQK